MSRPNPHLGATIKEPSFPADSRGVVTSGRLAEKKNQTEEPQKTSSAIRINLISGQQQASCPFWAGFFCQGSESPASLMDIHCLRRMLRRAICPGIQSTSPIMLSDSQLAEGPRQVYLCPTPLPDSQSCERISQTITETLKAWNPPKVGLWFSPEHLGEQSSLAVLRQVLLSSILEGSCNDYYLLTEDPGIIPILNVALSLKTLLPQNGSGLSVFH
ncbi:MAG: hypothetical protein H6618_00985 [Deltaproteobacteria bacterium]|nr:hypothetical protein [Deltaproteobacteria bacterium]